MDTGSGLPQSISSGRVEANSAAGAKEQSAQIVRLSDRLQQNIERAQRVSGEVVAQNKDGSVRIKTDQGDIDVRIRGREQPQTGQRVEVDIPAGRPPRQVIVRQVPQATQVQNTAPQTQPAATSAQQAQPAQVSQASVAQRASGQAQSSTQIQTSAPQLSQQTYTQNLHSSAPQAAPVTQGSVVRLLPVTPAQANQIVQDFSNNLVVQNTAVQRSAFSANLVVQNVQADIQNSVLQILKPDIQSAAQSLGQNLRPGTQILQPALIQAPAVNAPAPGNTILTQILNFIPQVFQTQNTSSGTQITQTVLHPLAQQNTLQIPVSNTQNFIQTLVQNLSAQQPQPAQNLNLALNKIDVQIQTLQNASVVLSEPVTSQGKVELPLPVSVKIQTPIISQNTAATMTAQVTGFTQNNLPLVTLQWQGTPLPQSFVMQFNASNLQLGSQIQIIPQSGSVIQAQASQTLSQTFTLPDLLRGFSWPVLDDAYQTLLQVSPQAAQSLQAILPNPATPAQIGSAALLFIAAVRSGDIGSWLGDKNIDILRRAGKTQNISRLSQELGSMNRAEPVSQDWRGMALPLYNQGEIQKITLYYKNDHSGSHDQDCDNTQTRFIFDLDLSRMGGVQLDGLMRDKRLDLVVRTENPFSQSMQQVMRLSYSNALEQSGLHGELNFQGNAKNWVHVLRGEEQLGVDV